MKEFFKLAVIWRIWPPMISFDHLPDHAFEHVWFFIVLSIKLLIAESEKFLFFLIFSTWFDFYLINSLIYWINMIWRIFVTLLNCGAPKRSCVRQHQLMVITWLTHNRLNSLTKVNNERLTFARDPLTPHPLQFSNSLCKLLYKRLFFMTCTHEKLDFIFKRNR